MKHVVGRPSVLAVTVTLRQGLSPRFKATQQVLNAGNFTFPCLKTRIVNVQAQLHAVTRSWRMWFFGHALTHAVVGSFSSQRTGLNPGEVPVGLR
jgi:hypothetical protein